MKVDLSTVQCPSCKHDFFVKDFNHACDKGVWYSACLCDCGAIIDGNEVHDCPLDRKPIKVKNVGNVSYYKWCGYAFKVVSHRRTE